MNKSANFNSNNNINGNFTNYNENNFHANGNSNNITLTKNSFRKDGNANNFSNTNSNNKFYKIPYKKFSPPAPGKNLGPEYNQQIYRSNNDPNTNINIINDTRSKIFGKNFFI